MDEIMRRNIENRLDDLKESRRHYIHKVAIINKEIAEIERELKKQDGRLF